jgi:prephenate dehydrogenase
LADLVTVDDVPSVGIVGLGLIGGSLARALVAAGGRVVATTRTVETQAGARALGVEVVDDLATVASSGVDVVVAATALAHLPTTVTELGSAIGADGPTVTDVGSVKGPIAALAAAVPTLVPGHPMAGTEHSGWEAGTADLFAGRTWALAVEPPVDLDRWAAVARLALAAGSEVVPVDSIEHDDVVALVSHLPYVLAALAAGAVDAEGHPALARSLAAGSFDSLTRVAGGHPTLGAEMAVGNAAALAPVLRTLAGQLEILAASLDDDRVDAVTAAFDAGRHARETAAGIGGERRAAILDRAGLLDLGRSGGRVVAVHEAGPDAVTVEVVA